MKIKSTKLLALVLAIALVFTSLAIVASADNDANTFIKVSSVANLNLSTETQTIYVSLSGNTKLDAGAKICLEFNKVLYSAVSAANLTGASGSVAGSKETGNVVFTTTAEVNNTKADDEVLFTITFKPLATSKGVDKLSVATSGDNAFAATINGGTALDAAADVIGEVVDSYRNLFGIGLNGYITLINQDAPVTAAKVIIDFTPYAGSTDFSDVTTAANYLENLELIVPDAKAGMVVMSNAADMKTFLTANAAKIAEHVKLTAPKLTYGSFAFTETSLSFNGVKPAANTQYTFSTDADDNVYNVTLTQLQETSATIKVVFRTAMDSEYYHGSDIPEYTDINITGIYAGDNIYTQATVLAYMQEIIDLYNEFGGDLDTDNDGVDDISVDGVMLNQWIVDHSGFDGKQQYDLGDFTLDTSVVRFNDLKVKDGMTYSLDATQNVYTVYMDQINVPRELLVKIGEELGKINYTQFANLNVLIINEAIGAFQAAADSIVEAEWPSADDVDKDKESGENSPGTGDLAGIGSAIVVALALTACAAVVVRKKED